MINVLRMDVYRLITNKVMLLLLLVFAAFQLFGIYMMKLYEQPMEGDGIPLGEMNESQFIQTLMAQPPSWILMYIMVFTVYFYMSEYNAGFYRNYITMSRARLYSVISKMIVQALFVLAMFLVMLAVDLAGRSLFFNQTAIGDPVYFAKLLVGQFLLHWAFSVLILFVAMLTRNMLASISIGIVLALNVVGIGLAALDSLLGNLNFSEYWIVNTVVTIVDFGNVSEFRHVLVVALSWLLLFSIFAIRYKLKEDLK